MKGRVQLLPEEALMQELQAKGDRFRFFGFVRRREGEGRGQVSVFRFFEMAEVAGYGERGTSVTLGTPVAQAPLARRGA